MNNSGNEEDKLEIPNELSRNIKRSQDEMDTKGGPEGKKLLMLSLNPKPEGETLQDQLNFNMPGIDETLRDEFPGYYGKGSFTSLCRKIVEIRELARNGTTLADIINQTKASLKLIELATRSTSSLSDEEIDEALRLPEKTQQFTGKTHQELTKIVEEIRIMDAKSSLADIVRDSKASIRLISLATQKPNLDIQQIDQAIHTASVVTREQNSEALLDPTELIKKVKAIKASAKLKSLSVMLEEKETKASLTLIELALKDKTITGDEELKQALRGVIPPFDLSTLDIEKIQKIRSLATRNTSFSKIVEQSKVPLRLVAIATAKRFLEEKEIQLEMKAVAVPIQTLSWKLTNSI